MLTVARHDYAVGEACRALITEDRIAVLRCMVEVLGREYRGLWEDLARIVVGDEVGAFEAVLACEDLRPWHLLGLAGMPDGTWSERAGAALDAGYDAQRVVKAAYDVASLSWVGDESTLWKEWSEAFEGVGSSVGESDAAAVSNVLREVARLGAEEAKRRQERAALKERREAVFGREV